MLRHPNPNRHPNPIRHPNPDPYPDPNSTPTFNPTPTQVLLRHLQVAPAEAMACGDAENDVEMLGLVGLGVAMGNANPLARAAANVVVGTNDEDGVAEAVQRYVLGAHAAS